MKLLQETTNIQQALLPSLSKQYLDQVQLFVQPCPSRQKVCSSQAIQISDCHCSLLLSVRQALLLSIDRSLYVILISAGSPVDLYTCLRGWPRWLLKVPSAGGRCGRGIAVCRREECCTIGGWCASASAPGRQCERL